MTAEQHMALLEDLQDEAGGLLGAIERLLEEDPRMPLETLRERLTPPAR